MIEADGLGLHPEAAQPQPRSARAVGVGLLAEESATVLQAVTMKFGVSITAGGKGADYTLEDFIEERIRLVRAAHACGFDLISAPHHYLSASHSGAQPMALLSRLAPE